MLSVMTPPAPAPATPAATATRAAEIAAQLRFAVLRLSRRLRQHAVSDVTPSQLSALHMLARDGRMTLRQLADAEQIQPPSITRIVDSLVAGGLVTRTTDERDRRIGWVEPRPPVVRWSRPSAAVATPTSRSACARSPPTSSRCSQRAAPLLERLTEDVEP